MKGFITWFVLLLVIFAGISLFAHTTLSAAPRKVLIAIDESYRMSGVQRRVVDFVKEQKKERYTKFAIITNRRSVHSWQPLPKMDNFNAFGSWPLSKLLDTSIHKEINEADRIYILTNAKDQSALGVLPGKAELILFKPLMD